MIKKTLIAHFETIDKPNLILIPGGPGISSNSIRSFDELSRNFNLHYIDFPGTNGNPYDRDRTFEELSELLVEYIEKLSGEVFLLGHSFGGLYALEVANRTKVDGVICVATPFSNKSFDKTVENYNSTKTVELIQSEREFESDPSDINFSNWLANYGRLYFCARNEELGRELLESDPSSAKSFLFNGKDGRRLGEKILDRGKYLPTRKLFIAGEEDGLLPVSQLRLDADRGGFVFFNVADASHFVMLDQPIAVARLIEDFSRQD